MEVRCATLQKQVAEMNERDLQNRKQNQLLQTKLKTLEENKSERKSLLLPPPAQARLRCNLKMEDEEGELFNNMYLADLQSSRCVSPMPSEGGFERFSELMRRNSMRLPHLRTHYAALAPDGDLPADDTRENVSTTFDDSSTGLITRRKVSGITSYKRPGPPTPSKKAGRLSLSGALPGVGSEVQYKEALQDSNVNAGGEGSTAGGSGSLAVAAAAEHGQASSGCRTSRTKTPGKFKQMLSSSNLLSNFQRDEGSLNGGVCDEVSPAALPGLRHGVAIRHSKKVSQHTQRSVFFDLNRQFSPDANLPSPRAASAVAAARVQTVSSASRNAHHHPTVQAGTAPFFSALSGCSVMQLPGNSLYKIRRQQMLRREQRNRQVDLQRKIDGSPLRYQAACISETNTCDTRDRHGAGGCDGSGIFLNTALNAIAECSSIEEEQGHRLLPVVTTAVACWPGTQAATTAHDFSASTFSIISQTIDTATSSLSLLQPCGKYQRSQMHRRQQRHRQSDLQRQIERSPWRCRATCAIGTNSPSPTGNEPPSPPLSSTLAAYASGELTGADSGFGLTNVSAESLGSGAMESSGDAEHAQSQGSPGVSMFLFVIMALGLLA
uniref:Uncharacterized protein n=1 Tax=Anopheles atroparvus TaxID=41427 RepID=A0A182J7U7_ANOAO